LELRFVSKFLGSFRLSYIYVTLHLGVIQRTVPQDARPRFEQWTHLAASNCANHFFYYAIVQLFQKNCVEDQLRTEMEVTEITLARVSRPAAVESQSWVSF